MTHYRVDTYHGPLVLTDCGDRWIVASPFRPPEVYDGSIPADCLTHAVAIEAEEARSLVGGPPPPERPAA